MGETEHVEIDPLDLRNALGHFASGITIANVLDKDGVFGMTANAFISVSMDPPLVLISADNSTTWHEKASQAERYTVSILSEEQQAVAEHFAGMSEDEIEVPFVWRQGLPLVEGAIAHFICKVFARYPAGDHTLYVGQVEHLNYEEGARPLLFYTGEFERLGDRE